MIQGGCFCGKIRYCFPESRYRIANCHCAMCRKTSGAPFVTWVVVPKGTFSFIKGSPKELKSSDHGIRYFCADCGTPLTFFTDKRPDDLDVTTGSLDRPDDFVPKVAIHEESKLSWLKDTE